MTALNPTQVAAELEALRSAANAALAHVEGRRNIFSTRDPKTVASILRQALGSHVNEDRGKGWRIGEAEG